MVVPVRVRLAGAKDSQFQLAHTLDATENGVRLAGFEADANVGDAIELQYRRERAMFRVVWIRGFEKSSEKQLGAEAWNLTGISGTWSFRPDPMSMRKKSERSSLPYFFKSTTATLFTPLHAR